MFFIYEYLSVISKNLLANGFVLLLCYVYEEFLAMI